MVAHRGPQLRLCQEGGPTGYGFVGGIVNDSPEITTPRNPSLSLNADALTLRHDRLLVTAEQGMPNQPGGTAMSQLPPQAGSRLAWHTQAGHWTFLWAPAEDGILETAPTPQAPGGPAEIRAREEFTAEASQRVRFFRLRATAEGPDTPGRNRPNLLPARVSPRTA
jgi:hypothetical protein